MRTHALLATATVAATVLGTAALAPAATAVPAADAAVPAAAPAAAPAPAADATADFNGDGYPDLAIGAPTATVGGLKKAGAISVVYGSATGFQYSKASFISQATPGVPGTPVAGGRWQRIKGFGDFDGDGYDDLVVAPPGGTGGTVLLLWGSANGLTGASAQVPDATGVGQRYVGAMGVGDVNGDGHPDLLSTASSGIRIDLGPFARTGEPAKSTQPTGLLDYWVMGFRVGDMTGDGIADVIATSNTQDGLYKTVVLRGTPDGLVKGGSTTGLINERDYGNDNFGDVNKDGYPDFVSVGAVTNEGKSFSLERFTVTFGGPQGVSTTLRPRTYTQDSPGVPGVSEDDDSFGESLAVADVDQDGYADVVVGAPGESGTDAAATRASGAVTVLRGSATGLTTTGAKVFTQNSAGIPSTSEVMDHFGRSLRVLDADGNGAPELYVGGEGEDGFTGRVWKLATAPGTGVTGTSATAFNLATLGGPTGGASFGVHFSG
ncbi:FG-GAP-like repeat-containing protein [Streptomyces sp. NRRL S-87]|uniref:FG-GAP-like repeat-containing protein n=1 Tax=Streptomyces sp. NRRL S-87 TaxID=1463920 RepID=UPI0004C0C46A|nr:FG-GAP-like repeat-containing protein [Streptomyces sp. NRRL S-87]